jgi:hypothetical protein
MIFLQTRTRVRFVELPEVLLVGKKTGGPVQG